MSPIEIESLRSKYADEGGDNCPFCGSKGSVNPVGTTTMINETEATQDVECSSCGRTWKDLYGLKGIVKGSVKRASKKDS